MRPHVVVVIMFTLLAWAIGASADPQSNAGTSARPEISGRTEPRAPVFLASLDRGLVPSVEEKKRTPKPAPEKKKEESKPASSDDEDQDCAGAIAEGIFAGMCGGDEEEETAFAPVVAQTAAPVTPVPVEFIPFEALISPSDPVIQEVEAWGVAGGASMQGQVVFTIPRESRVQVTQKQIVNGMGWLWVHRLEAQAGTEPSYGWVPENDVQRIGTETGLPTGVTKAPPPVTIPSAWQLNADIAVGFLTNDRIELEYDKAGLYVSLCAMGAVAPWFYIGGRVGWMHTEGDPNYIYETSMLRDNPLKSEVDIVGITVPIGHSFLDKASRNHFSWSIGPGIYLVKESADIEFARLDDGEITSTGLRTDSMTKVRFGGELRLAWAGYIAGGVTMGMDSGISMISWNPKQVESLGLDWLDSHYFAMYYVGLTVSYIPQ